MICYRDMTFCPFWRDCSDGKECFRRLTDEVQAAAREFGLPIARFAQHPECWRRRMENKQ